MLTVISPAKTLDFSSAISARKYTEPVFLDESKQLVEVLRQKSASDLKRMMKISDKLATMNVERFQSWSCSRKAEQSRQAILAFKGDVYLGLQAETFKAPELNFAQKHLRILSGLYGILRPLDLIQPYRLEMGSRLSNSRGSDLYQFWGDILADSLARELKAQRGSKVLINLASQEYFRSVAGITRDYPVITPVFKDYSNGSYRVLGFFAKKARGLMANYIISERINDPQALREFKADGYGFNASLSADDTWVFTRKPDGR